MLRRCMGSSVDLYGCYEMNYESQKLYSGIMKHDRTALAKAITMVESKNETQRHQGETILYNLLQQVQIMLKEKNNDNSIRLGITGPPGVGKSSLINLLGFKMAGVHKVAVLAIDPSSEISGGSILGDKTRMSKLTNNQNVFIRPSPNSCFLGGINNSTMDTICLCESAGYDIIMVETVGVGQSETSISRVCDMVILLVSPTSGDYLQGMKKGINEISDLILINKCDGNLVTQANETESIYRSAVGLRSDLVGSSKKVDIFKVSAQENINIDKVWRCIKSFWETNLRNGFIKTQRSRNSIKEMWSQVQYELSNKLQSRKQKEVKELQELIYKNMITPKMAARKLSQSLNL
ncbi:Methylmalonic aciduria type A, mitochondrial [Thelohanellus kitauei]|uniref:Methylmalonic aciduria type A, mitochondrial n=1 Tax=Thelohanellus kitauei TaxID=669202 RepID=A0A0C2JPW3_THEKT|nr:Methylmalonic aciduria type A, mitochondrial [Thelohanellus kitauei]